MGLKSCSGIDVLLYNQTKAVIWKVAAETSAAVYY
jgi:hypothetical protein